MPAKLNSESFLATIRRSGLVEDERLDKLVEEYLQSAAGEPDSTGLAQHLVTKHAVTAWQGEKLLQGKHKGFFLGKYRLLALLGRGGMSSVYLAEHIVMRRRCAIKVLPQKRVSDTSYLGRFHREAQAVASLDHPNIVRAYDVDHQTDRDTDIHFLVMEFVDGQSLQELVQRSGQRPFIEAADHIRQAALGLAHAHGAGLVHRDIKPGNLLVDHGGTVKVLDLGLARFFSDSGDDALTIQHDEKVLGTADYLAPEQALDSHSVDARADLYSLGCTLYFLLTGQPPFTEGTLAQRLMAHQTKEPPPLESKRPDVPADLSAIVRKLMAKSPHDRPPTAQAAADLLLDWLQTHADAEWLQRHRLAPMGSRTSSSTISPMDSSVSGTTSPAPPASDGGFVEEAVGADLPALSTNGDELSAFLTALGDQPSPQSSTVLAGRGTNSSKKKLPTPPPPAASTSPDFNFLDSANPQPPTSSSVSDPTAGAALPTAKQPSSKATPIAASSEATRKPNSEVISKPVPRGSSSPTLTASEPAQPRAPLPTKPDGTAPTESGANPSNTRPLPVSNLAEVTAVEATPVIQKPVVAPVRRTAKVIRAATPAATTSLPIQPPLAETALPVVDQSIASAMPAFAEEALPVETTAEATLVSTEAAWIAEPASSNRKPARNRSSSRQPERPNANLKMGLIAGGVTGFLLIAAIGYYFMGGASSKAKPVDFTRPDATWIDRRAATVGPKGDFQRISDALAKVRANFQPNGDKDRFIIDVATGTYAERLVLDSRGGGKKWPENITVQGAQGAEVVIKGNAEPADPVVKIRDVQGFKLSNVTIDATQHDTGVDVGEYLYGTSLDGVRITGFTKFGLVGKDVSGLLDKEFVITNSQFESSSEAAVGIRLEAAETLADVTIQKSLFIGPLANGIQIETESYASKIQIRENRFFECETAVQFQGAASLVSVVLSNNTIVAGNSGILFARQSGGETTGLIIRRNLFAGLKGPELRVISGFGSEGWKSATGGMTQGNVTDRTSIGTSPGAIDLATAGGSRLSEKIVFKSLEPGSDDFLSPKLPTLPKLTDKTLDRELGHIGALAP